MTAPAGYTTVSASHLTDSTGALVANATIYFQPCDNTGNSLSYCVNGAGQSTDNPVSAAVTNGVFSVNLADTSLTSPKNIGYLTTLVNNVSGKQILGPGYIIQPAGAAFNFDAFIPNLPTLSTIQTGPPGPQGLPGGTMSTAIPLVASGSGSAGVSEAASPGDHVHPSEVTDLAIAPASIAIGNPSVIGGGLSITQRTGINWLGGAHYFTDSAGNVWMYVDLNGIVHFPIGMKIDSVVFDDALSTPGITINDEMIQSIPWSWLASSKVTTDSVGNVAMSILPTGEIYAPEGFKGKYLAATSVDSDGMVYYSQLDGASGLLQIFKSDPLSSQTWKLTSTGNNYAPQISSDGTKLAFISDRNGFEQVFLGDLWAYVKTLPTQDVRNLYQWNHVAVTGQSLAIGAFAVSITSTQPYGNLMFNAGPRAGVNDGTAVPSGSIASLVPLVESTQASGVNTDGETICSGMANRVTQDMLPLGVLCTVLASISGEGAQPYAVIKKGASNSIYANTLTEVTQAKALAVAAGKTYGVRAVCLIHGEADQINNTLYYDQLIQQLQRNISADIKAITGQATDIPLIFCQISEWTSSGGGNTATPTIPFAQLAAHEANPGKCILVGPKYHLPYGSTPHLTPDGYRRHGEYYGKVLERIVSGGKPWRPLSPRVIQRSGNQIMVEFWVPVKPLVIDTVNVTSPTYNPSGLDGFEYFDNSGSPPAITALAVVSPTAVLITLASAPTGTGNRLRYAYTCPLNTAATSTAGASGPRGCLRDSDVSTSVYGYQMYNWCVHFDKAC